MAARFLLKSLILTEAFRLDNLNRKKKKSSRRLPKPNLNEKNQCRICGERRASISIFDNEWQRNISEEIADFSSVIINKNDNLPKHICQACLDLLDGCIIFKKLCLKTQEKLNQEITEFEKQEKTNDYIIKVEFDESSINGDDSDNYNNCSSPEAPDEPAKLNCEACSQEYCDKESYNWHLPFCEGKNVETKAEKPNKKQKRASQKGKQGSLCELCGKTCINKYVLATHMTTHKNVFPYKCDVCPYRGRTPDLLRTHKRTHLADKPYKCTLCPKTATTCSNLRRHVMTRHRNPDSYVKCNYCDKLLTTAVGLSKHVKNMHLRHAGGHECDICFRKYSSQKILRGHRYKVHKITPAAMGRLPDYLIHQLEENHQSGEPSLHHEQ